MFGTVQEKGEAIKDKNMVEKTKRVEESMSPKCFDPNHYLEGDDWLDFTLNVAGRDWPIIPESDEDENGEKGIYA